MKRYISAICFFLLNAVVLNSDDVVKTQAELICDNDANKNFIIYIKSNKLDLDDDALQDNLGGYVDIPAADYYIKTKTALYYLEGMVEKEHREDINLFRSTVIKNRSKNRISAEELKSLADSKNIKFIQKIDLEKNNKKSIETITTKNILNIYFEKVSFNKEYQKCKEQFFP